MNQIVLRNTGGTQSQLEAREVLFVSADTFGQEKFLWNNWHFRLSLSPTPSKSRRNNKIRAGLIQQHIWGLVDHAEILGAKPAKIPVGAAGIADSEASGD
jgi:hypothetical protein